MSKTAKNDRFPIFNKVNTMLKKSGWGKRADLDVKTQENGEKSMILTKNRQKCHLLQCDSSHLRMPCHSSYHPAIMESGTSLCKATGRRTPSRLPIWTTLKTGLGEERKPSCPSRSILSGYEILPPSFPSLSTLDCSTTSTN